MRGASTSPAAEGRSEAFAAPCQPAWFDEPLFFKYEDQWGTSDPLIHQLPFNGLAWGLLPNFPDASVIAEGAYTPDPMTLRLETAQVRQWSFGGPYFAFTNLRALYDSPPPEWDAFRMRSLNGAYYNGSGSNAIPFYSLSSPVFQAFIKARAREAVDIGADGFLIDDPGGQVVLMFDQPAATAGTFDTVTMAAFRSWLQQQFSPAALQTQFGISDISTFDFGAWINSNGLTDTWNTEPVSGLALQFFLFKRQETVDSLRDLISSTKQYAREIYGRDFPFTCNCGYEPSYGGGFYFTRDTMDLTTNESYYLDAQTYPSNTPFVAPFIRAGNGWKASLGRREGGATSSACRAPQLVLAETGPPGTPGYLTKPTSNLMRVIFADIYAAGGAIRLRSGRYSNGTAAGVRASGRHADCRWRLRHQ